jgi:four helix bundle protein
MSFSDYKNGGVSHMATIERFEDIQAWQMARQSTRMIYDATSTGTFSRDFPLRDQIRRSAISIMSNIAEGFDRDGNKEFLNFLSIAKGSCAESRAQLYVALDGGHLSQDEFDRLYKSFDETGRLIGGFMRYLSNSEITGKKFKTASTRNSKPGTRN